MIRTLIAQTKTPPMPANKITVPTKISASVAFNRKNHMKLATTINDASGRAFLAP